MQKKKKKFWHAFQCVASPFLLITLFNYWDTGYAMLQFCKWNSFGWCKTSAAQQCGDVWFSSSWQIWTAVRPVKPTHSVSVHAEWSLVLSCWNKHGLIRRKCCLEGSICHSINANIRLCVNGAFTHKQVTYVVGTDAPPYHDRCWFLHLSWIPIFLGMENWASVFHENKLNCGFMWPQHTCPCELEMSLWCMNFSSNNTFQVTFFDTATDCRHSTSHTKSLWFPMQWSERLEGHANLTWLFGPWILKRLDSSNLITNDVP